MSKKGNKTVLPSAEKVLGEATHDAKALEARSVMAHAEFIKDHNVLKQGMVGKVWNMPDQFKTWHVVRLDTSHSVYRVREAELRKKGFIDCPRGVHFQGYTDSGGVKYLMCPNGVWESLRELKRQALKAMATGLRSTVGNHVNALRNQLPSQSNVEIIHAEEGRGSADRAFSTLNK